REDANRVIVTNNLQLFQDEKFRVFVIPLSNGAQKGSVGRIDKVSGRVDIHDFADWRRTIHRAAWLSEKDTEIDFPPNCPPRLLILVTIEKDHIYLISRDFDSSYQGIVVTRQE